MKTSVVLCTEAESRASADMCKAWRCYERALADDWKQW